MALAAPAASVVIRPCGFLRLQPALLTFDPCFTLFSSYPFPWLAEEEFFIPNPASLTSFLLLLSCSLIFFLVSLEFEEFLCGYDDVGASGCCVELES